MALDQTATADAQESLVVHSAMSMMFVGRRSAMRSLAVRPVVVVVAFATAATGEDDRGEENERHPSHALVLAETERQSPASALLAANLTRRPLAGEEQRRDGQAERGDDGEGHALVDGAVRRARGERPDHGGHAPAQVDEADDRSAAGAGRLARRSRRAGS